ncbi:MAG: hypothetical protein WA681_11515, partial [Candidatus Acidiferrales bacterium]
SVRFPLPLLMIPTVPDPFRDNETELALAGITERLARTTTPSIRTSIVFIIPPGLFRRFIGNS